LRWDYTSRETMDTTGLTRHNLMLEKGKVDRLRRQLRAQSNSEAVRKAVEEAGNLRTSLQ
jgi:hypothetical protein